MADELEQVSEDLVEQAKADKASKRNIIGRTALFFKQVVGELNKVTKPTWAELRNYTGVVLAFVAVVMAIISLFDWLFYQGVVFVFTPIPQDEDCVCVSFFWGAADFLWPIIKNGTPKITHKKKNLGIQIRFNFFHRNIPVCSRIGASTFIDHEYLG